MNYEKKLKEMGITLPEVPPPLGAYIPAVQTGNLPDNICVEIEMIVELKSK